MKINRLNRFKSPVHVAKPSAPSLNADRKKSKKEETKKKVLFVLMNLMLFYCVNATSNHRLCK